MILSCPKFCVTKENSLRWSVFQARFKDLEVEPVFHGGRDYSTVCTQIVQNNNNDFIIFEDDACPVTENYLAEIVIIEQQLRQIHIPWDVLYLGAHLLGGAGEYLTKRLFYKIQPYCTHAVFYRASAIPILLNLKSTYPNIDQHYWDDMVYQSNLVKLAVNPMIITQADSAFSLRENLFVHDIMENSYQVVRSNNAK